MKTFPSDKWRESRRLVSARLVMAAAALLWSVVAAKADSPGADFSATANPNGVWSYGYSQTLGSPFILFTTPYAADGAVGWNYNIGSNDPVILYNGTPNEINVSSLTLEPGELSMHPGPDDEICLLRYTAPASGSYRVNGLFYGRDHVGTTTDVHLLVNGASVFDGLVNGYGPGTGPSFGQTVLLQGGDTLDFAVGYGANGNYFSDTTVLLADVTNLDSGQPTVALASPPHGATLVAGETLPLAASVTDPSGIARTVQFFINGIPVADSPTGSPFVTSTTVTTPGTYTLTAVVTDSLGRTSASTESFNVVASDPDAPAPTVVLDTPLAGRNLLAGSTQTVTFEAAPGAGPDAPALSSVSLYADGVLVAAFDGQGNPVGLEQAPHGRPVRRDTAATTVFQTPYQVPGSDKLVNMIVVALDNIGQTAISGVATFHATVTDDVPLQAFINGLTSGSNVAVGSTNSLTIGTAAVSPSAAVGTRPADDNGTLALLEYYIGQIGHNLGSTPSFTFDFQPPAAGRYVLHSVATDRVGIASISEPLIVNAVASTTVSLAVGGGGAAVEGGAKGVVIVSRTGDTSLPLTVSYKAKGTAKAGVDYKTLPGSITIPAGAAKAKIKVKPIDGSPNASVLKVKLMLQPSVDGSFALGTRTIKVKLIGK